MKKTDNPIYTAPAVTLITDKKHYAYLYDTTYTKKEAVAAFGNNLNKFKKINRKDITETALKTLWKNPSGTREKFKVLGLLTQCDPAHYAAYYTFNAMVKDMFDLFVNSGGFFKGASDIAEFFRKVDTAIKHQ